MMTLRRRNTEASERFAQRRAREEAAPRLKERAPDLQTLKLEVEESADTTTYSKHTRIIVVDRAPALFVIPCGDTSCTGGGYEITDAVMHNLRMHSEHFDADDRCMGTIGSAPCRRVLHVNATATYSK